MCLARHFGIQTCRDQHVPPRRLIVAICSCCSVSAGFRSFQPAAASVDSSRSPAGWASPRQHFYLPKFTQLINHLDPIRNLTPFGRISDAAAALRACNGSRNQQQRISNSATQPTMELILTSRVCAPKKMRLARVLCETLTCQLFCC